MITKGSVTQYAEPVRRVPLGQPRMNDQWTVKSINPRNREPVFTVTRRTNKKEKEKKKKTTLQTPNATVKKQQT